MSFVSYAQNFEDVILWRALSDVENGRYIDIGAQEPTFDSVSCAFYKAGWRGVHVEPAPVYAAKLRDERPDETVIEAAVTDAPGPIRFFELGGLSSGREDVAEHHVENGHHPREIMVPTVRLDRILELEGGDVHWLKIDVEGMEADVLRSWGSSEKRPWVLVIESTYPNSQETTEHLWIDQVLAKGYRETFFDGVSRYFVHETHSEIAERLNRPANVFDRFQVTSHHFAAALTREEFDARQRASESRVAALNLDIIQLKDQLHVSGTELARERVGRSDDALRLRNAESELAVECAKLAALQQEHRETAARAGELKDENASLSSELMRISVLTETEGEERLQPGSTYAAVKSRLAFMKNELGEVREFAVQQFLSGQKSRAAEVDDARTRLTQAEAKSNERERERERLQALVHEQAAAMNTIRDEAAQLQRGLADARQLVSSIYASRSGRLAARLRLLPPATGAPIRADLGPGTIAATPATSQGPEQTSTIAQPSGMDTSLNDLRHTSGLLALNGSAFVDALYRTFLKRSPDRAGRDHYLARLQAGRPKEDILLAVAGSPEARSTGVKIEGLSDLQRSRTRAKRWFFAGAGSRSVEAKLNRLEYTIGEAQNSLVDRLDRIESSLEQIQSKISSSSGPRHAPATREPGVYVQGVPMSIKRGVSIRPTNGAAEFIGELRDSVQGSLEALSLRNGR